MPLDLLRPAPRRKTPFPDAKQCFGLLGLASTVLVVSVAVLLSGQLLFSALPQLCAAIRCCLLRHYIFFAVNFMVLLLVLLKLTDWEFVEEGTGGGAARLREVSPDEWFDALSSPTSFGDVTTEDNGSTSASPLERLSDDTAEVSKSGFRVSFLAPFRDVTTKVSGSSTPASFLEPADSPPGGSGSDEFYSCPPTPSRSPVSSPLPAVAVTNVKPSRPAEEADDSMGATWKVISRRETAALHLKKRSTWDNPPPVEAVVSAARGRLRIPERFQEEEASPRRAVLEKRMKGREVAVAKGRDEKADDSMDAKWKEITGGATASPHFKSSTWDAPPSVEAVVSAARGRLRIPERFQEEEASPRRTVLEKRMKGREVAVAKGRDEEADDSMDAMWKEITGGATASRHFNKSSTWDAPPSVEAVVSAARGRLRIPEIFPEEEAYASPRRTVLEKRMKGREVAVAKGRDEEADDSMDAKWKEITGGATASPHFNKSSTWDAPPSVEAVLSAARAQLRKSETFQEAAGARRAVLEKRMKGREVTIVEDRDEMNRRFDAFIKNFNEQLKLQRLASLRRRRYMDVDILYSA